MSDMSNQQNQRVVGVFEATQASTLARIDERTSSLVETFKTFRTDSDKKMEEIKSSIKEDISNIEKRLDEKVSHETFKPIKLIVYGLAGVIFLAVAAAVVGNVIPGSNNGLGQQIVPQIPNMSQPAPTKGH